jgi:hypothetical protein
MCQTIKNLLTRKPENRLFLENHKKTEKEKRLTSWQSLAKSPLRKIENLATGKPQNHLLLAPF